MRSLFCAASVLASWLLPTFGRLARRFGRRRGTPSIKTVMEKLHKGGKSPLNNLKAALKGELTRLGVGTERGQTGQEVRRCAPEERPAPRQEGSVRKAGQGVCSKCEVTRRIRRKRKPQRRRDAFKKIQNCVHARLP